MNRLLAFGLGASLIGAALVPASVPGAAQTRNLGAIAPAAVPAAQTRSAPPLPFANPRRTPDARRHARTADQLDRMIGQMIMVGFRGRSPAAAGVTTVRRQLAGGVIGGVMLMGHNISGRKQLKGLTASLVQASPPGLPALIAIDQEGGKVQRLRAKNGFRQTGSARAVAGTVSPREAAERVYPAMARQLRRYGINVNFGPVVDVDVAGARNPIIGRLGRSYGANPATVVGYARAFMQAHKRYGVITAAKHFPGHGSSLRDSHKGFTDISRTWRKRELVPYRELARSRAMAMVMVGHLYHREFSDGRGIPTSLSSRAIKGWLRGKLDFDGVVITDDMEMGAIRKNFGFRQAVVGAVRAGNDILLYSNTAKSDPRLPERIHAIIRAAVMDGRIPRPQIERSYRRIVAMKRRWLGAARQAALED